MADTKDWTVVLRQVCDECSHDVGNIAPDDLAEVLFDGVDGWHDVLNGDHVDPARLVTRPAPQTWSPVEYGSHVADVIDVFQQRIFLMLTEDNPTFASFDPEAAVAGYAGRSPAETAARIAGAANRIGDVFSSLAPHLWDRPGVRGDGASFTVLSISRYLLHDMLHHLFDVRRQLSM
jgi:hypothetical protein